MNIQLRSRARFAPGAAMMLIALILWGSARIAQAVGVAENAGWKAGVAKTAITPKDPLWMAGYASRTTPSEGKLHDLWAKALMLEDARGKRSLLITLDLCGIGRDTALPLRTEIAKKYHWDLSQVVLACSHTHSGPVVGDNLITMYKLDESERNKIQKYTQLLTKMIGEVADRAAADLQPAELAWDVGQAAFAVNRRTNVEGKVPELRQQLALQGPVDHDVPVLRVKAPGGKIRALVCGYACHCTTLSINQFSGDYAGFAQIALEKTHPDAVAMFVAGCGGDQNPLPRRTVELAENYGNALAKAVTETAARPMRPIAGNLRTTGRDIPLSFAKIPEKSHWETLARSDNFFESARARKLLKRIADEGNLPDSYPYPIQIWSLGDQFRWIFLGGEVVVDYSLRLKRNLGVDRTWVSAYANDVMAYIPSLRVLKEGGYEGGAAMIYYAQPAVWSDRVEEQILNAVKEMTDDLAKPGR